MIQICELRLRFQALAEDPQVPLRFFDCFLEVDEVNWLGGQWPCG